MTGDLAMRDADGYFWFVGRADDVIKSAGHLIGPFEVESALMEHPAVAEAGVIGKPDPVAGERFSPVRCDCGVPISPIRTIFASPPTLEVIEMRRSDFLSSPAERSAGSARFGYDRLGDESLSRLRKNSTILGNLIELLPGMPVLLVS